jgi:DNA-binding CsgD family transcriptional regulator
MTVSETELCRLAAIVTAERDDLPAQGLPPSLLSDLMEQIRCDAITFQGMDSRQEENWFLQGFPEESEDPDPALDEALDEAHWRHYWDCLNCSYPERTGDLRTVVKIADFYSDRRWRSSGMYTEVYRPQDIKYELQLCLPRVAGPIQQPGRTVRLYFFRLSGGDFSERDRALLTLVRPHLYQAYLDAERRRDPGPGLTPRQTELLRLVADGHTNAQIARRLGLSEGTVRTHLENIFSRLQVSSRTAAVLHAFPEQPA